MLPLRKGRLIARLAETSADVARAQALRWRAFRTAGQGGQTEAGFDADAFDPRCAHLLVEEASPGGALLACCRLLALGSGAEIGTSYSAQFYDLARLARYPAPMLEVGRFCTRPGASDPDVLRLAWGALTRLVDAGGVAMLFGASSFAGTDAAAYGAAFAHLAAHHLAPPCWMPAPKAAEVFRFARGRRADHAAPMPPQIPPLLRSYLAMGGWVSDHAVRDSEMNTLHVFTGVEIASIPPGRARLLRALAADAPAHALA
ncbi:GNAT family N-acetyltransferase [Phaeovulum sp.]|uniref:GNAT family N-acetyltransferase n=1 Tax=Phaeovulum sp. TaxID=2934796 RepID=UPI00272F2EAB|nr:GNAT family N-acetyltransferase [Phaeovulum sp.]MDP1670372.1 GNAT family N-acyltransferase [Phaeovulum sp.]MDP3861478.1 GNAT family N-acyltransferase [Phaeovulum sp.]MDZ4120701.1 GNAT family N-acyltransferase [Phaeovulum sp.]